MCWARSTDAFAELFQWVRRYSRPANRTIIDPLQTSHRVADGTILAYQTMLLNTGDKDSDENFERALKSTKLDGHGELVKALTVRGMSCFVLESQP